MLDKNKTENTKASVVSKKTNKKIEKFKNICQMTQPKLKSYLVNTLKSMGYKNVYAEDGFVYAVGEKPVMLLAHMDTVHKSEPILISAKETEKGMKLSSPFGIGGDDRCGVFMILEIIKDQKCSVLFTEDEEIGCVGAKKFTETEHISKLDVNYMIQFDRRGWNDAVFYQCDNPEFTEFITQEFFEEDYGSCSDISEVAPKAGVAAVNLSCGYYHEHTTDEYVIFEEMTKVIEEAKKIIDRDVEKPFEYIEQKGFRGYSKGYSTYDYWGWDNYSYNSKNTKRKKEQKYFIEFFDNTIDCQDYDVVTGESEADAWFEFCKSHGTVCYDDVYEIFTADEVYDGFYMSRQMMKDGCW